MGLRETLEAAMPWPWVADEMLSDPGEMHNVWRKNGSGYVAVAHDIAEFDDARLIALAPELAAGNLETIDFLRWLISDPDHAALLNHDEACTDDDPEPCDACALLARLDAIGREE